MKLSKQDILKALETISVPGEGGNMVETGAVKNVMTFGDEVIVDITITNPSLQAKKRTEVDILKTIHDKRCKICHDKSYCVVKIVAVRKKMYYRHLLTAMLIVEVA